jgi:hypothetical protein
MRITRPLLVSAVAALALSVPTVGQANRGGVPHNGTHNNQTVTHTPQADKPCPDKDKGNAKRKGASKGHKRGANKGRKCGQH